MLRAIEAEASRRSPSAGPDLWKLVPKLTPEEIRGFLAGELIA